MKSIYLAFAASVLLGASSAYAGALVPNKTVDIRFVGFCDGMHLVINENTGLVTGNLTGCAHDPLFGTVGSNSRLGAGISVLTAGLLYVIDDFSQTFTNYQPTGARVTSGTYAVGFALRAAANGARSTSGH